MGATSVTNPRIAIVGGQWAQNVGNAFFNIGGKYVAERVFGEGQVGFIQDHPGYRTLHNKLKGNPENYLDPAACLDIDYLIIQGPVLNSWMAVNWASTFEILKRRGTKIILLSCAFFKFTAAEIESVRKFLEAYPPELISTRDPRTYRIISEWLPRVPKYSGIDSGFFVNDAVMPFRMGGRPFFAMNFDRYPEPEITTKAPSRDRFNVRTVRVDAEDWHLSVPKWLDWTAHRSKVWSYIGSSLDRRDLPGEFCGLRIVRTEHRFFPHVTSKIYRHANATASDEPWTYLSLYANAEFVLADRVHACVAALAYGKRAMLFTPSPRAALFEAVDAGQIRSELLSIDADGLQTKKRELLAWLRNHVS